MNKKNKLIKGKWWDINNKVKKIITAKYDKIKDWVIDPKGYFLISVDKDLKIIRAAYCVFKELKSDPQHDMIYEIRGYTALEIVNTIIANNLISSLQHAADLGIELHKAEIALKKGLEYIQDQDLKI